WPLRHDTLRACCVLAHGGRFDHGVRGRSANALLASKRNDTGCNGGPLGHRAVPPLDPPLRRRSRPVVTTACFAGLSLRGRGPRSSAASRVRLPATAWRAWWLGIADGRCRRASERGVQRPHSTRDFGPLARHLLPRHCIVWLVGTVRCRWRGPTRCHDSVGGLL